MTYGSWLVVSVVGTGGGSMSCFSVRFVASDVDAALILLLLKLIMFFILTTRGLSICIGRGVDFSILIDSSVGRDSVLGLRGELSGRTFIGRARCVSGGRTLHRRARTVNASPRRFLNCGPFATSVRVGLRSSCTGSSDVTGVRGLVGGGAGVRRILCRGSLVSTIGSGVEGVDLVLLKLTIVLAFVSFTLVGGAVHLTVCSGHFLVRAVGLIKTD